MMVAIEEQLGASNSAPGSLVLAGDPLIIDPETGQITGVRIGGAGVGANLIITPANLLVYIDTIVDNMVNNGATAADKTTLKDYFRVLTASCIADDIPENLPILIDPAFPDTTTIPNPYYDIEMMYRQAVRSYSGAVEAHARARAKAMTPEDRARAKAAAEAAARMVELKKAKNNGKKLPKTSGPANSTRSRRSTTTSMYGGNKTKKIKKFKTHRKKARNRKQSRRQ